MKYLFFSDLDGTLLDHDTYSYEPSREATAILREHQFPLILVSSKTFSEMKILHDEMELAAPFIFENGGGIYWPDDRGRIEYCGKNVSVLREGRELLESVLGEPVRFISDITADEIVNITGLSRERALLSQRRMTSLPFILNTENKFGIDDLDRINEQLSSRGFYITKGGRFYHFLSLQFSKGSAIRKVIDFYRREFNSSITTVGIGDSENDIAMFNVVDIPVVVRKHDGTLIKTGIEHIRKTSCIGPEGFNEAVKSIIEGSSGSM
jgi:HAD-superfamily hydrolase, subfamily IIB/mannosyl-3-phosphoglycerate phosphatase family